MLALAGQLGGRAIRAVENFGDFSLFCGQTFAWIGRSIRRGRGFALIPPQLFEIGTRSLPVVMVTGLFVGMVLAVQSVAQFKALGMVDRMGFIVTLSVLRELGPVLGAVMLAGRVGGGLTAELGTMRVTEQIDALRALGASPIRVLVVPRFLACLILTPLLTIYADFMGIFGAYGISALVYDVNAAEFWRHAADQLRYYDIFYGLAKSLFFGVALGLICCHKGFRCSAGAAGVGRACTQAFVASCMAILALNLILGILLNTIELQFYPMRLIV
ncbi:MAG: MlaE family ABC transporter permease [Planctomycetota bacterium]|jgi:phospholipid/cholesterol/gamma-HCH transport system permease protein